MKKGKRGQASLIVAILLLILIMVVVVIAVIVLVLRPDIFGIGQPQPTQPQIVIRTIQESPNKPLCNYPYTQVGNTCCLDKNLNGICDSDEIVKEKQTYCYSPYIREGTSCCLDDNDNGICDQDEYNHHYTSHNTDDSSYLNSPFDIYDIDVSSSEIWIRIENTGDYDYIINSIEIEGCDTIHPDKMIYEGDDKAFTISCSSDISDRDVNIEYKRSGSDTIRTSGGRIRKD